MRRIASVLKMSRKIRESIADAGMAASRIQAGRILWPAGAWRYLIATHRAPVAVRARAE
jgi:hypothetical protein